MKLGLTLATLFLLLLVFPATASAQAMDPAVRDVYTRYLRAAYSQAPLLRARGQCQPMDPDAVATISAELSDIEQTADDLATQQLGGLNPAMARGIARNARNTNWQLVNVYAVTLPEFCG